MWAEACEMLDRAERMHRRFFRPAVASGQPVWEAPVDVYETADEYVLAFALPGVSPDTVEVLIERRAVSVVAERRLPVAAGPVAVHRLEIPHGRFERRLELPAEPLELGRRELADGCLVLSFRKLR